MDFSSALLVQIAYGVTSINNKFLTSDKYWQDNDGALNTISMLYPRYPVPHPHCWLSPKFKDGHTLQPGVW